MRDLMNNNDFQKWLDNVRQQARQHHQGADFLTPPSIYVSNDRHCKFATLEDRLTHDDRLLLHAMGISL